MAVQYIEIEIDFCSKVFGITCSAVLGLPTNSPPGDTPIKCFNTLKTCPARVLPEFVNVKKTIRFAIATILPLAIDAIPNIKSISFDSGTVALGQSIGSRSTITVTFEDHPHSDTGLDPYLADRSYDPFKRGTFWAKFRARVPYLRGRKLTWINGTGAEASIADMEHRVYTIDSYSGPSNNGEYVIVAKDLLKLADDDRSLAPKPSLGFLSADITDVQTTLALSPAGIISDYAPTYFGIANIGGSELVVYSNQQGYAAGGQPNAVTFDGTNDYLTRGAGLTGAADSKQITISGWIKLLAGTLGQRIFVLENAIAGGSATGLTRFALSSVDGHFNFQGFNAAGAGICTINTLAAPPTGIWTHFLLSLDLTGGNPANSHFYFLDANYKDTVPTFTDDLLDFTMAEASIGAYADGTSKLNGNLAELWIAPGVYMDFSNVTNRRKFITADFKPVPLGATGQTPTGSAPLIYFNQASPNWGVNQGGGGGFTLHGAFASATFNDGNTLNLLGRAVLNTPASAHKAQDRVQKCLQYQSADPAFIIYDLLTTYAGVPSGNIPISNWFTETTTYLNRLYSANIVQPTGVNTLISEVVEQAGLSIWWDDKLQQIGLQVLRGAITGVSPLTMDNVLADSLAITDQPDKRISSVHTYFGLKTPLLTLTDPQSFRSVAVLTDAASETNYGSAAIKEIFSRWIPELGRTVADRINAILLARFKDPPRHFKLQVMRDIPILIGLAQVYDLFGWPIQDSTGATASASIQVTRVKPLADIFEIEADEMLFTAPAEDLAGRTIIIDANAYNVNAKTAHDAIYPAISSGDSVSIIINAGVIVGSTSVATPAFTMGTWPAGVSKTLTINGKIQGKAGNGGVGGLDYDDNPNNVHIHTVGQPGTPGGTAFFTRTAVTIVNNGDIWAGAGGGGGGAFVAGGFGSSGGGGGCGFDPGTGAIGFNTTGGAQEPGADGTDTAGGAGGVNGFAGFNGGNGGGPGLAGSTAQGAGGAVGTAIDGVSFCTITTAGDRRGPEIN